MRTLLNACKTFITVHHNTSQCYVKRGCAHKKADMVWRCLTMFDGVECVRMCLTNVWHDLLSQALWSSAGGTIDEAELSAAPLPVTSASTALASTPPAKLCVHSAKVKVWHVIQNLLDWCSHVFIAASTWMNNNAEKKPFNQRITNVIYCNLCIFMIIYAWLCMYHAPSLVTYRVCPQSGLQWLSGRQKNPLQNPKQNPHGALRQCLSPVLVPVQLPQPKVPNASPADSKHLESNKFAENHRQFSGSTWLD